MPNSKGVISAVCSHCRRRLPLVRQAGAVVFFEQCPRHPHNRRFEGEGLRTVPHATASRDVMTVGVLLSALRRPRRGPYAL